MRYVRYIRQSQNRVKPSAVRSTRRVACFAAEVAQALLVWPTPGNHRRRSLSRLGAAIALFWLFSHTTPICRADPAAGQSPQLLWRRVLADSHWSFHSLAVSPDGGLVACGGFGEFRVLNARTGALVAAGSYSVILPINSVDFSPDSKLLAVTWPEDQGLRIYVARTGVVACAIKNAHGGHHISKVRFAPDGKTIASGGQDGQVRIWKVNTGRLVTTIHTGTNLVAKLCYTPRSNALLVACPRRGRGLNDRGASLEIQSWDTASWRRKWRTILPAGAFGVATLAISRDGELVAAACGQVVRVFKTRTQVPVATFDGPATVTGLAFGPQKGLLAVSSRDGLVTLCDLAARRQVDKLDVPGRGTAAERLRGAKWVFGLATAPGRGLLSAADLDGTVATWRFPALPRRVPAAAPAH